MPSTEIVIRKFEEIMSDFNAKLTELGSQITNRGNGGAFDLQIRTLCLMVADAYVVLQESIKQIFPSTASGQFVDLHAGAVGLDRELATKTTKEFICRRDSDGGVLQIPVGDVLKSPVLPARGELRFASIAQTLVDFTGTAESTGFMLVDNVNNFIADGVTVGTFIFNLTDGSFGKIESVAEHEIFVTLKGGTNNIWTTGDSYKSQKPSLVAAEFTSRSNTATLQDLTGAVLTDATADFLNEATLQLGQKFFNVTAKSQGTITAISATTISAQLIGGDRATWEIGDEYKLQSDLEIIVRTAATDEGTEYNNIELLLNRKGEEVEFGIESGFTGVDHVFTNGEDLIAGTDDETDADLKIRIANRWKELARGSTREAYMNFARTSSPAVFDANVYHGILPTDVIIVLSGVAGSRDLTEQIGVKVDDNDNFDSLYTDDGTAGGIPRILGITVHDYIRARAPMTDFIFLKSVSEVAYDVELSISVLDGFEFETVKVELLKRLRALFLVEKSVKDVEIMKVGEALLFSKLTKLLAGTGGVKDFKFVSPNPATNHGDTTIDEDKVFSMGQITIAEI